MQEPQAYLNGEFIPVSEAKLPIYDKGIVLGATVTEMTRTYHQIPFRLEAHVRRMFCSLRHASIEPVVSEEELVEISTELVAKNARLLPTDVELGLIHFSTAGKVPLYACRTLSEEESKPTLCAHTFPLDFSYYADAMRHGYHVVTPSIRHIPPQCLDSKMKYRSRLHWHIADSQTQLVDPDATSLLLDLQGNITECSGANFLLAKDGAIHSPTLRNILPGISRDVVIELACKLSIPFKEQDLQLYDVVNADEAFLSSTPFGICPATKVNGKLIGDGRPGSMWRRLADAWSELAGLDIVAQIAD